jgi:SAM-dependent methyltransferase
VGEVFDEDYYERGIETGVSCFENYKWLPELTIPAVMACIDYLGMERGCSVLDFGCAKGYYVKAFRMLERHAWGCDISKYALSKSDVSVRPFLKLCTEEEPFPFTKTFDYVLAKDVLEHMGEESVSVFLEQLKRGVSPELFVVVPLAKDGCYIVPQNEKDVTHIIRKTSEGWREIFSSSGWEVVDFAYKVSGLKERQTSRYAEGVGFFTLL